MDYNEYKAKLAEYADHFGDGFPTIPLANNRSDKEIARIIDICIQNNKNVYEMGYLSNEEDIKY